MDIESLRDELAQPENAEGILRVRLQYILDSPAPEHGGFHPELIETARLAMAWLDRPAPEAEELAKELNLAALAAVERGDYVSAGTKEWDKLTEQAKRMYLAGARRAIEILRPELKETETEYAKAIRTGVYPDIWPPISMTQADLEHFRASRGIKEKPDGR